MITTDERPVGPCPLLPEWARVARRWRRAGWPDRDDGIWREIERAVCTWELERAGFRIPPYVL